MSKKYESMVGDYWMVSNSIEKYVSSEVGDFEYWDTDLIKFMIDTESTTYTYDYSEASIMLGVSESQMKNFLVVHCCLNNNLDGLIGERDYDFWDAKGEQLIITLNDASELTFQTSDVCELMGKTESFGWSYADLVISANEIVAD
jgi:hypothetical protein